MDLKGKLVVITGAAGALGRAATAVAHAQGAETVLLDLGFPEDIAAANTCHSVDLGNREAVEAALASLQKIDAVFNIAGGFAMGPTVYESSAEEWNKMFAINVATARNMISVCVPKMLANGRGAVVNIGAYGALSGAANMSAYCASKSAVMKMTESLAEEVKHQGVNVNAVLPSIIDTPANRNGMPDADYSAWVTPEQLANVMCFLASDAASGIHGALIPVRGLS